MGSVMHSRMATACIVLVCAIGAACAIALVASGCGSPAKYERHDADPRGLSLVGEAQQAYRNGRYEQAISLIDSAAAYVPDLPDLWFLRGLVLADVYRFEASDSSFERTLRLDPLYRSARFNLGHNAFRQSSYFAKDGYREALEHYRAEEALLREAAQGGSDQEEVEKALAAVLLQIGSTYWNLNLPDSALQAYRQAVGVDSLSARGYAWLAGAQRDYGDLHDALTNARRAAEIEPDNTEHRLLLGVILREAGDSEEAATHLKEAAAREPWNRTAVYNFGQALIETGRSDEGTMYLGRADSLETLRSEIERSHVRVFQSPDDPERWENYAVLLHHAGRVAEAQEAARVMRYLKQRERTSR